MNSFVNEYRKDGNKLVFDCGCEFNYQEDTLYFIADLHRKHTVNFDCPYTYRLLSEGITQGIFQLRSPLGTQWSKKVQPTELEHISALGSILRPGCMQAKDDKGISTTIHYERRKNAKEEVPLYHPVVDDILKNSYNCLIYQEQSMEIAVRCAGFNPSEADILRRGIGHKEAATIAKCKKLFLEKCKETKVLSDEQAEQIFSWIEKSNRYAFNHSHALVYAVIGYVNAYIKAHFPLQFYKSWLKNTDDKAQYPGLVNEAKILDITVNPTDIRDMKPQFYCKKKNIYFGLSSIKGILKGDIDRISQLLEEKGWLPSELGGKVTWMMFMSSVLYNISSRTADGLIHSGALDCFQMPRAVMALEYEYYCLLTNGERKSLAEESSLEEFLQNIVTAYEDRYKKALAEYKEKVHKREISPRKRSKTPKPFVEPKPNERLTIVSEILHKLQHPLYNIVDTLDSILFHEEDLLGVALTRHATNAITNAAQTHSCMDIMNGYKGRATLKVKIDSARPWACKNGSTMCFLKVSDETCIIEAICFSSKEDNEVDGYQNFRHLLTTGNIVFVSGQLGEKGSFIINRVYSIT